MIRMHVYVYISYITYISLLYLCIKEYKRGESLTLFYRTFIYEGGIGMELQGGIFGLRYNFFTQEIKLCTFFFKQ